ncbi:hypothetical protein IEQ34_018460 [Dendrobium chrysotoxum]|uniref:GCK domain-containing protein n=1 Tax=Dendrobium chrysotoxum TaxID=161865 RepID=A0AAV7G4M7_DENCH|nr:hypothetical protein IEQ34_018460 [Dendrobium chrysotoxum]
MDPSSSSVGFPLSGNPQSSQNPPPLHPPSGGISHSENPQATVSSSTSNPSSSTERPYCNGPPTFVVSSKDWNVEMTKLFHDDNFRNYMCGGECRRPFTVWYNCMHNVIDHHNGNWHNCSHFAGALRDCVFANLGYYKPLLTYFSDGARRSSS